MTKSRTNSKHYEYCGPPSHGRRAASHAGRDAFEEDLEGNNCPDYLTRGMEKENNHTESSSTADLDEKIIKRARKLEFQFVW